MLKVTHIISGLGVGGAEMMLYNLLSLCDRQAVRPEVISLTETGPVGQMIQALGIPVRPLGMVKGWNVLRPLSQLTQWLRQARADVVQTWMYHADLLGGLAARLAGIRSVVWGIHTNTLDPRNPSTIWIRKACALLSGRLPAKIVCCSTNAQRIHADLGYAAHKMVFIPNGFNLASYRPDPAARLRLRQELGLPASTPLIGLMARFHPDKDHDNFVRAAALLHARCPQVHFVLCGSDIRWENPTMAALVDSFGLRDRFHLLGLRRDAPRLYPAFDMVTSSSAREAFPMVVGEAMASEVPCVVTDVGDSAFMVADTGNVVPPKDPQALAAAWADMLEKGHDVRRRLGMAARRRVQEHFDLRSIVARYGALYGELTGSRMAVKHKRAA